MPRVKRQRSTATKAQIINAAQHVPGARDMLPEIRELSAKQMLERIHNRSELTHRQLLETITDMTKHPTATP